MRNTLVDDCDRLMVALKAGGITNWFATMAPTFQESKMKLVQAPILICWENIPLEERMSDRFKDLKHMQACRAQIANV